MNIYLSINIKRAGTRQNSLQFLTISKEDMGLEHGLMMIYNFIHYFLLVKLAPVSLKMWSMKAGDPGEQRHWMTA